MLRSEASFDTRLRDRKSSMTKSAYGAAAKSVIDSSPGAVKFRSTSRVVTLATPTASEVRCVVGRADAASGAGLLDSSDTAQGLLVITGGKNGSIEIRSALTGAAEAVNVDLNAFASNAAEAPGRNLDSHAIAVRTGTQVSALCLGPGNKLWVGYNDGALRVYGLPPSCNVSGSKPGGMVAAGAGGPRGSLGSVSGLSNTNTFRAGSQAGGTSTAGPTRKLSFMGVKDTSSNGSSMSAFDAAKRSGSGVRGGMAVGALSMPPPVDEEPPVGLLAEHRSHCGAITAIVRTDGAVFTASQDWKVLRWSVNAPFAADGCVGAHSLGVRCLLTTPRFLVSGGEDHMLKLWPFQPLDRDTTLEGHSASVTALANHRGLLWSGADDGTIRLWDLERTTKDCVQVLTQHTAAVTTLAPLDNTLYSCDKLGNILVWDLTNAASLISESDEQIERNGRMAGMRRPGEGVELLHCFRAPVPNPRKQLQAQSSSKAKSPTASTPAAASAANKTPGRKPASSSVGTPRGTNSKGQHQASSSPAAERARSASPEMDSTVTPDLTAAVSPKPRVVDLSMRRPAAATNVPHVHSIKLVSNVSGVVAWVLTSEGSRMAFLPHRPIRDELERKLGGDLEGFDMDGPALTRDEIIELQRQLETMEEREALQVEALAEQEAHVEEFAGFTSTVLEDVLQSTLQATIDHQERCEALFKRSEKALGVQSNKDLGVANARIQELEQINAELETKMTNKSKVWADSNAKHARELQAKADEIAALQNDLAKTKQQLKHSDFERRHAKDALAITEATIKRQGNKLEKQSGEKDDVFALRLELRRTQEQLEIAQKSADSAIETATRHTRESVERLEGELETDVNVLQRERDQLRRDLAASTMRCEQLQLDLLTAQSERDSATDEAGRVAKRRTESVSSRESAQQKEMAKKAALAKATQQRISEKMAQLSGNNLESIVAWRRAKKDKPAVSIADFETANRKHNVTGLSQAMKLRLAYWPDLCEMYAEASVEAQTAKDADAAKGRELKTLQESLSGKEADLRSEKEKRVQQSEKVATLQAALESLKKKMLSGTSPAQSTPTGRPRAGSVPAGGASARRIAALTDDGVGGAAATVDASEAPRVVSRSPPTAGRQRAGTTVASALRSDRSQSPRARAATTAVTFARGGANTSSTPPPPQQRDTAATPPPPPTTSSEVDSLNSTARHTVPTEAPPVVVEERFVPGIAPQGTSPSGTTATTALEALARERTPQREPEAVLTTTPLHQQVPAAGTATQGSVQGVPPSPPPPEQQRIDVNTVQQLITQVLAQQQQQQQPQVLAQQQQHRSGTTSPEPVAVSEFSSTAAPPRTDNEYVVSSPPRSIFAKSGLAGLTNAEVAALEPSDPRFEAALSHVLKAASPARSASATLPLDEVAGGANVDVRAHHSTLSIAEEQRVAGGVASLDATRRRLEMLEAAAAAPNLAPHLKDGLLKEIDRLHREVLVSEDGGVDGGIGAQAEGDGVSRDGYLTGGSMMRDLQQLMLRRNDHTLNQQQQASPQPSFVGDYSNDTTIGLNAMSDEAVLQNDPKVTALLRERDALLAAKRADSAEPWEPIPAVPDDIARRAIHRQRGEENWNTLWYIDGAKNGKQAARRRSPSPTNTRQPTAATLAAAYDLEHSPEAAAPQQRARVAASTTPRSVAQDHRAQKHERYEQRMVADIRMGNPRGMRRASPLRGSALPPSTTANRSSSGKGAPPATFEMRSRSRSPRN